MSPHIRLLFEVTVCGLASDEGLWLRTVS